MIVNADMTDCPVNAKLVRVEFCRVDTNKNNIHPRHDEDLREPLMRRQGSQVSMRVRTHA